MNECIIRVMEFANGNPCPIEGLYLLSFDHDAHNGQGDGVFTLDINKAMRFPNMGAAMDFWRRQSTVKPLRPDGRPNKPLTACSVLIDTVVVNDGIVTAMANEEDIVH